MTFIDLIIFLVAVVGLIMGYRRGLIRQAASLAGIVAGVIVCQIFGDTAINILKAVFPGWEKWPMPEVTPNIIALSLLFIIILLLCRLAGSFFKNIAEKLHLGLFDKIGGCGLGIVRYLLILSILLNFLLVFKPDSSIFTQQHMLNNKPFQFTLDLMPTILGSDSIPSSSVMTYNELKQKVEAAQKMRETLNEVNNISHTQNNETTSSK
ncbi:MAG: CvpA family protein [Muribaculaceae bacterium]|nr:CvpA family protein [Muribaculaceae bacterium]